MHNIVLQRINQQIEQSKISIAQSIPIHHQQDNRPIPILPEQLREILMKEFPIIEEIKPPEQKPDFIHFNNIYEFVEWYKDNLNKFNIQQNQALLTLVDTRQMIENGCGCKRRGREAAAFEYFQSFWLNNATNDLLPALLIAADVKKVSFGKFLSYP